jgi:hypothetical protein
MWYNPLVTWLLRSPLHGLMSANTLLLTYTGRKSGRSFTFPISYGREGDMLWLITRADKPWWKNIRGGAPVQVCVAGQDRLAEGEVMRLAPPDVLERIRFVYRGIPAAMAEKTVPTAVVVKLTLQLHS